MAGTTVTPRLPRPAILSNNNSISRSNPRTTPELLQLDRLMHNQPGLPTQSTTLMQQQQQQQLEAVMRVLGFLLDRKPEE
jgi:hypothetical protein